jgi:hypothetical protein
MCHFHGELIFKDKLLANHNELMYPLFFIESARKRKFAKHLQAKVYHKRCHNRPNLQKKFLLGRKEFIFNEIYYKVDCNVTKLIFNNVFSNYGIIKSEMTFIVGV